MCNYAGFGIEGTNWLSLLDITHNHIDFNDTIIKRLFWEYYFSYVNKYKNFWQWFPSVFLEI